MKILLIRPARIKQAITLGEFMYSEPIGLEMIYAMLEKNHEIEIMDLMSSKMKLEDKLNSYNPEVVGITSLCIDVHAVIDIAKNVKKFDSRIVTIVGGTQAYLNEEAFFTATIDHVMNFTTTDNINKLFEYLSKKMNPPLIDGICSRVNGFESTKACGINEYVHPNRKSTEKYRKNYTYFGYKPCAIMGTAQGCSKTCSFCLRWRIEGPKEKYFPMDFVREELLQIEEQNIMIFDNDFLHNGNRIKEFCDVLEEEAIHKKFICYASVDSILKNKEIIKRFRNLGLSAVLIGYETFKNEELKKYRKKSSVDKNIEASKFLKEINLDVWASFILHPDWNLEDFKEFRKYLKILSPEISTFSPLTPFPNLPLYDEYFERLLVHKKDYEKWSFGEVTIVPSKLSLSRYYFEILKTNLYVNLYSNNIGYIINKFGYMTISRMFKGSVNGLFKYIRLMIKAITR